MLWYLDGVSQEFLLLLESLFQTRGWFEVQLMSCCLCRCSLLAACRHHHFTHHHVRGRVELGAVLIYVGVGGGSNLEQVEGS